MARTVGHPNLTPFQQARVVALYRTGLSLRGVAVRMGIDHKAVLYILKKHGEHQAGQATGMRRRREQDVLEVKRILETGEMKEEDLWTRGSTSLESNA